MGQGDLPLASGTEHVKAFERCGWECGTKKAKDAHFILKKPGANHAISIPAHKEVKRALLQKQIKAAGLTEEQYLKAFSGRRKTTKGDPKPSA